jgi:hypothetical protein
MGGTDLYEMEEKGRVFTSCAFRSPLDHPSRSRGFTRFPYHLDTRCQVEGTDLHDMEKKSYQRSHAMHLLFLFLTAFLEFETSIDYRIALRHD